MDDLNAKGGSYQRQKDGALKLVSRTEEPQADAEATEKPVNSKSPKTPKDAVNG